MRQKGFITLLLATAIFAGGCLRADAQSFLNNRQDWANLSYSHKAGYVMGAFDEAQTSIKGIKSLNQFKTDVARCALELNIKAQSLIDLVENAYNDPKNWEFPPSYLLHRGLREMCLRRINEYRAERGQEPYPD